VAEARFVRDQQISAVEKLLVTLKAETALSVFHHIEGIRGGLSVAQLHGHAKEIVAGLKRVNTDLRTRLEPPPFDAYRADVSEIDAQIGAMMDKESQFAAIRDELQQLDVINAALERKLSDRQIPTHRSSLLGLFHGICNDIEMNDRSAAETKALLNQVDLLRRQNARLKVQLQRKRILDAIGRTAAYEPESVLMELSGDLGADMTAAITFVRSMTSRKGRVIERRVMQSAIDGIELFISRLVETNRGAREAQKALIEELRELRRETIRKRVMMAAVLESA
jgi:hypothetical protein